MAPPLLLRHPSSREHDTGDHPEQPARIVAIERALESRDWLGYEREQAPRAERAVVEGVHPSAYIQRIEDICAQGGGMLDLDTVASARSFDAAMHSAGGSVRAVEALLSGEAEITFCGLRPPGHHAEAARAMGFCLFNNVAIAARRALDGLGAERVLVLDWDVHHGNGSNDIFYDTDAVLYFSIHQSPLYPGTGSLGENGTGAGLGYTINLPVAPGAGRVPGPTGGRRRDHRDRRRRDGRGSPIARPPGRHVQPGQRVPVSVAERDTVRRAGSAPALRQQRRPRQPGIGRLGHRDGHGLRLRDQPGNRPGEPRPGVLCADEAGASAGSELAGPGRRGELHGSVAGQGRSRQVVWHHHEPPVGTGG